ncbi:MAG: alpha-L-fucosidase, partial [Chitinophagaceae bacterium]|nr:alpha-L-fucosidase [Chitinophagaceae bacterium]
MKKLSLVLLFAQLSFISLAQPNVHPTSAHYVPTTDPQVAAKLDQWQDQKFGIIIHWGLYAVP